MKSNQLPHSANVKQIHNLWISWTRQLVHFARFLLLTQIGVNKHSNKFTDVLTIYGAYNEFAHCVDYFFYTQWGRPLCWLFLVHTMSSTWGWVIAGIDGNLSAVLKCGFLYFWAAWLFPRFDLNQRCLYSYIVMWQVVHTLWHWNRVT